MAWTSEMDARLKELHAEGHSCATIGAMMGKSRNAVIGRIHRIDLPRRGQAYRKKGTPRDSLGDDYNGNRGFQRSTVRLEKVLGTGLGHLGKRSVRASIGIFDRCEPLPSPTEYDVARVSFDDLERHHCRFPVGEPAETGTDKPLFCGDQSIPGLPYCAAHARRCFAPPPQRKQIHDSNVVEFKREREVA